MVELPLLPHRTKSHMSALSQKKSALTSRFVHIADRGRCHENDKQKKKSVDRPRSPRFGWTVQLLVV